MTEPKPRCDTLVSLRDYIDMRLESVDATLVATEKALNARLEAMNEFRAQILMERGAFVPRGENELAHARLTDDIRILRETAARAEGIASGKASMTSMYASGLLAILGLIVSIIGLIHSMWK